MLNFRSQYFCSFALLPEYGILLFSMGPRLRGDDDLAAAN